MEKYLGGPILSTVLKLVLASVGVGVILAIFGIAPLALWEDFLGTVAQIWDMGFDLIDWAWTYFLIGAIIVVPIWLLVRFWSVLFQGRSKE